MHKCTKHPCPKPATCKCRTVREANIPVIWLVGASGSGKKTHGVPLAKQTNLDFYSTGQMIRDEISTRSKKGVEWEKMMNMSELIPSEQIIQMLEQTMTKRLKHSHGFIISFIKAAAQTELFEKFISPVDLIIYLKCSEETILARQKETGEPENPEDEATSQLETFDQTIAVILRKYKNKIKTVNSDGTVEEVYEQLPSLVEEIIAQKLKTTSVSTCD